MHRSPTGHDRRRSWMAAGVTVVSALAMAGIGATADAAPAAGPTCALASSCTISGTSNIFDAGHAVPPLGGQLAVRIPLANIGINKAVVVSNASGGVAQGVNAPSTSPDGGYDPDLAMNINSLEGISGVAADAGSGGFLAGVFTSDTEPVDPAPAALDYTAATGEVSQHDTTFSPVLNQQFFVGDGLTGTGAGSQQTFTVPAGATSLWLGVDDAASYQGDPFSTAGVTGGFTATVGLVTLVQATGAQYVAMGDSYSSGEGAPPFYAETDVPDHQNKELSGGCHRSMVGWPLGIAASQGLTGDQWKFVACSGAVIHDFTHENERWAPEEVQPPQVDALSPDTRLVTFTMGGNDVGFEKILSACVGDLPAFVFAGSNDCSSQAHKIADPQITRVRKVLPQQIELIASKISAGGKIVVGTYPRLFGTNRANYLTKINGVPLPTPECALGSTAGGQLQAGITRPSATTIDDITDQGDQAIIDSVNQAARYLAAHHSKVTVVVTKTVDSEFHGHRLCDTKSSYINGVVFASPISKDHLRLSFHPNVNGGQQAYQKAFTAAIKNAG